MAEGAGGEWGALHQRLPAGGRQPFRAQSFQSAGSIFHLHQRQLQRCPGQSPGLMLVVERFEEDLFWVSHFGSMVEGAAFRVLHMEALSSLRPPLLLVMLLS